MVVSLYNRHRWLGRLMPASRSSEAVHRPRTDGRWPEVWRIPSIVAMASRSCREEEDLCGSRRKWPADIADMAAFGEGPTRLALIRR